MRQQPKLTSKVQKEDIAIFESSIQLGVARARRDRTKYLVCLVAIISWNIAAFWQAVACSHPDLSKNSEFTTCKRPFFHVCLSSIVLLCLLWLTDVKEWIHAPKIYVERCNKSLELFNLKYSAAASQLMKLRSKEKPKLSGATLRQVKTEVIGPPAPT
mmetsp:Transcript_19336/g.33256  ORF Transcript_19336/g.33256 Transcript_19336/m.33256 type:complete len:158 (-) Transcript_19336:311-784(-)